MNKVSINARAKINLTLDVLGKRSDGYHEVEMVMQTIELHDRVLVEETGAGVEVVTDHPLLTEGTSNIAYKAAKALIDRLKTTKGLRIIISKEIPVAAGLAGGSTDAAAVMTGINKLWNLGLKYEELAQYGAEIGSDIPFCIRGGTAVASGRGERISPLPDIPEMWMILAKPRLEVSTAEIYKNFRADKVSNRPDTKAMIGAIKAGETSGILKHLVNVLESVTLERYPQVAGLKSAMSRAGVAKPLMSGSGPSVFGFVETRKDAEKIACVLRQELPDLFVAVTRTYPSTEGIYCN